MLRRFYRIPPTSSLAARLAATVHPHSQDPYELGHPRPSDGSRMAFSRHLDPRSSFPSTSGPMPLLVGLLSSPARPPAHPPAMSARTHSCEVRLVLGMKTQGLNHVRLGLNRKAALAELREIDMMGRETLAWRDISPIGKADTRLVGRGGEMEEKGGPAHFCGDCRTEAATAQLRVTCRRRHHRRHHRRRQDEDSRRARPGDGWDGKRKLGE
jgi:hypothetical protein